MAYSGGRDSTALLHATWRAATPLGLHVAALHVHHGLSLHADAWQSHCDRQCVRWVRQGADLSLHVTRLQGRPRAGQSVEAWARTGRYQALRAMAIEAGAHLVLLAHHRRDQAETFLLQALRGGGVAALSGMPRSVEREGLLWCRPWLEQPRAGIDAYVRHFRLDYVDDDSNANERFERNRMRRQVWPALTGAFEQAEAALSDAARWAQDAHRLAQEVGEQDVQACRRPGGALDLRAWGGLSPARARNALREWFRAETGQAMPASLFKRLQVELAGTGTARWPAPGGELMRYRQALSFRLVQVRAVTGAGGPHAAMQVAGRQDADKQEAGSVRRGERATHAAQAAQVAQVAQVAALSITRCGRHPVPAWQGELMVRRAKAGEPGVPLALLRDLRPQHRQGREQFQLAPLRPARGLKKQFQALGVPEHQRGGPLLWAGSQLVFVPGLGLDARVWAPAGPGRVTLEWRPLA